MSSQRRVFRLVGVWLVALCVMTQAAPPRESTVAKITKFDSVPNNGDGSYYFIYETSDAQRREERGEFKAVKEGEGILTVRGSYSFVLPDGKVINVNYLADDKGYRQFVNKKAVTATTRISSAALGSLVGGGIG